MYYIVAQAIGFLGAALYIISYQFKENRWLIPIQLGASATYVVHFFMLGAYTGSALQIITLFSYVLLTYNGYHKDSWAAWKGWKWIISGVYLVSTLFTWKSWIDFLPCLGSISTTLGNWTRNGKTLRLARLCVSGPGWLIYDTVTHSYSGILCEAIGIISLAVSIHRHGLKELDRVD